VEAAYTGTTQRQWAEAQLREQMQEAAEERHIARRQRIRDRFDLRPRHHDAWGVVLSASAAILGLWGVFGHGTFHADLGTDAIFVGFVLAWFGGMMLSP
jgi:hypothetical protein